MSPDAITRFMDEAASLIARDGAVSRTFEQVGERLRRLAGEAGVVEGDRLGGLHGASASAAIIGRHRDGSVLMLARFSPEAPTPVHNHNSWGVLCVVRGEDRYERWERLDDGSIADRAEVSMAEELTLRMGDVVWFDGPPHDLHAQQGIGEAVWELVYFGNDPNAAPRAYVDPRTGAVTYRSAS